jgi:hypothetical protein
MKDIQNSRSRTREVALPIIAATALALALCAVAPGASAAPSPAQAPQSTPVADFGSPPSGEIPILYNDHTVYTKPDILKQQRVLAAMVKGGVIYVPLRSMFEQMGATVSVSADGKTTTASKSGATVSVTLGSAEVVINGESRPLDVPPVLYHGVVLVPVRVISEALGAYVLWVPGRRLVVVRYIPPTPVPTPAPVIQQTPPPVPTAAPTPAPTETPVPGYIEGALTFGAKDYNEFSAGQYCRSSYVASGAYAIPDSPYAVKVDYRNDAYVTSDNSVNALNNHFTRFGTIDGGFALTPVFLARQSTLDGRLEYQVAAPKIYVGVSYLQASTNYGYPHLDGFGVGVEKLPDLTTGITFFGSAFYYPTASGNYTVTDPTSLNVGKTYRQQYRIVKYDIGASLVFAHSPVFIYGGFSGDQYTVKQNAPIGQTHDGLYAGLGVKL